MLKPPLFIISFFVTVQRYVVVSVLPGMEQELSMQHQL